MINLDHKFYKQSFITLKDYSELLEKFENRLFKTSVFSYNNKSFMDLNFKFLVETEFDLDKSIGFVYVIRLETMFDHSQINSNILFHRLFPKFRWHIIKYANRKKYVLPGRVLNSTRKGKAFCVGICGLVGLLSKKKVGTVIIRGFKKRLFFRVQRYKKKRLYLSRKQITKRTKKIKQIGRFKKCVGKLLLEQRSQKCFKLGGYILNG